MLRWMPMKCQCAPRTSCVTERPRLSWRGSVLCSSTLFSGRKSDSWLSYLEPDERNSKGRTSVRTSESVLIFVTLPCGRTKRRKEDCISKKRHALLHFRNTCSAVRKTQWEPQRKSQTGDGCCQGPRGFSWPTWHLRLCHVSTNLYRKIFSKNAFASFYHGMFSFFPSKTIQSGISFPYSLN